MTRILCIGIFVVLGVLYVVSALIQLIPYLLLAGAVMTALVIAVGKNQKEPPRELE